MVSFVTSLGLVLIAVPLVLAAVGIFTMFRGLGHVARGEHGRGLPRVVIGAPLGVIGLAFSLLGVNTAGFERLTYEAPVAIVSVKTIDASQLLYDVAVKRTDADGPVQHCRLQGDEWEMSARMQKWKPWANVFGLDTTYTLDQMSNRYSDAARANGKTITSCDLKGPPPPVNQWVPKSWLFWIVSQAYVEERYFGSGAYMPLVDGAVYRVVMTQSGLNAEPVNDVARKAKL